MANVPIKIKKIYSTQLTGVGDLFSKFLIVQNPCRGTPESAIGVLGAMAGKLFLYSLVANLIFPLRRRGGFEPRANFSQRTKHNQN